MEAQEFLNRIDEFKNVGNLISNYREAKKNCDVMQMVNYFEEIVAKIEIFSNLTYKEAFEVLQKKESQCLAILENAIAKTNKITKN